jgi:carbon monoxide dehydrogenase subunit G
MRFETEFSVAGTPATVIERFADLPAMARFMPGAIVGPANEDGSYPGSLTVKLGPKRLIFNGTVRNEVDQNNCTGRLTGSGGANMRAAKITAIITYSLVEIDGAPTPTTRVLLISDAEMYGVIAEFAKTAGASIANAMLEEFGRRFGEHSDADIKAKAEPDEAESQPVLRAGELTRIVTRSTLKSVTRRRSRAPRE